MTDHTATFRLPRYATTFVGRGYEQSVLASALESSRLVALVGPGGVGKTRLASITAGNLAHLFRSGVFFADLTQVSNPDELCARTAAVLGMRDSAQVSPTLLLEFVQDLQALVILDGCDSLDSDCLLLLQDLVDTSAETTILATSRRALHIDGCRLVSLSPLSLPGEAPSTASLEDVTGSEAAALFLDRARLVRPEFGVTASQAPAMARLCHRLDGLPLAIELAAAWTRALSLEQIFDRMAGHTDFPRAGTASRAPRHRTLRTLTAASYELCTGDEKLLWARLSVFENTFDLASVEAVCSGSPLDSVDLVDLLASLVDQSVVVVDAVGSHARYRLLCLIRDYGDYRLDDLDDRRLLQNRHLDHYRATLTRLTDDLDEGEPARLEELRLEYPNILAAIDQGLTDPELSADSLRMAAGLWHFWFAAGQLSEGRSTLRKVLASENSEAHVREREYALCINAYLCVMENELRPAEKLLELAALIQPLSSDPFNRAVALQVAGVVEAGYGRLAPARDLLSMAIDTYATLSGPMVDIFRVDAIGVAVFLAVLARDSAQIDELSQTGLALCDDFNDYRWRGYIEYSLAVHEWLQSHANLAREHVMRVAGYSDDHLLLALCVELLAWCAQLRGQNTQAAKLFGGADRLWRFLGGHFSGFHDIGAYRQRSALKCRTALGDAGYEAAYGAGAHMRLEELVSFGIGDDESAGSMVNGAGRLTRRESEVAELVARGFSNRNIASELTISPRTAESHVERILKKFGLENRTQVAAAWAHLHLKPLAS